MLQKSLRKLLKKLTRNVLQTIARMHIGYSNDVALEIAMREGNTEKAKKIEYEFMSATFSLTPLHKAVLSDNTEKVKKLLKRGKDVHATTIGGFTALHHAVICGECDIVRELLKHGASFHAGCCSGITPWDLAVSVGTVGIVEELLQHGASTYVDLKKWNKLLKSRASKVERAELLIKYALIQTCTETHVHDELLNSEKYGNSSRFNSTLLDHLKECICEIRRMKTVKVNKRLSLHEFMTLRNPNIMLYPNDECIREITDTQVVTANYPVYSNLILPKVNRALLLGKCSQFRIYPHVESKNPETGKVMLDLDCTLHLAQFLPDEDLEAFTLAFHSSNRNIKECSASSNGPAISSKRQMPGTGFNEAFVSNCTKKARLE